jgi:lipoate-protein ligase A
MNAPLGPDAAAPVRWDLRCDLDPLPPEAAVAGDEELLDDVARGPRLAMARIWQSLPAIVVPAPVARRAEFAAAARQSADAGWPAVVRRSGGAPVPLAPGIVNLSLGYWQPAWRRPSIDDGFCSLAEILIAALRPLGVETQAGPVAGAFCAGRFDLGIGGRKIAGLAQRRRPACRAEGRGTAVLVHALLLANPDLDRALAALDGFERRCGIRGDWRADAVTSVDRALGAGRAAGSASPTAVAARLRCSFAAPPVPLERRRAPMFAPPFGGAELGPTSSCRPRQPPGGDVGAGRAESAAGWATADG